MIKASETRSALRRLALTKTAQLMPVALRGLGTLKRIHELSRSVPKVGLTFQRLPNTNKELRTFARVVYEPRAVLDALKARQAQILQNALHEQNWNAQYLPDSVRHLALKATAGHSDRVRTIADALKARLASRGLGDDFIDRMAWLTGVTKW